MFKINIMFGITFIIWENTCYIIQSRKSGYKTVYSVSL